MSAKGQIAIDFIILSLEQRDDSFDWSFDGKTLFDD